MSCCLTSSQDITAIAKPLFDHYPLTFFDFLRIFNDGSFITFATNRNFIEYYYNQKEYKFFPVMELPEKKQLIIPQTPIPYYSLPYWI